MTKNKKVAVAMSGGVDSSVAVAMLKKQGYDVMGVFCQFWFPQGEKYGENRCCSLEAFNQAKKVTDILDIPIYKLNIGKEFKQKVVDAFLKSYKIGKTPNPCVNCNKFIKFDLLFKKAKAIWGVDYLATGHYVKNEKRKTKNKIYIYHLWRGKDKNKDQSYFLYNLNQKVLPYLLFPVGGYTKSQVRKLAKKFKLPVFDRKDSQEICFVGKSHYSFLKKYLKLKSGSIISSPSLSKGRLGGGNGTVLGTHQGLPLYTLGQRTGIGLSGGPWFVAGFNYKENQLIVTKNQKDSSIFQNKLIAENINWVVGALKLPLKCQAQIRYRSKPVKCRVERIKGGVMVEFEKKQRAIMPGQSVVFYKGKEVIGGGEIGF